MNLSLKPWAKESNWRMKKNVKKKLLSAHYGNGLNGIRIWTQHSVFLFMACRYMVFSRFAHSFTLNRLQLFPLLWQQDGLFGWSFLPPFGYCFFFFGAHFFHTLTLTISTFFQASWEIIRFIFSHFSISV